MDINLALTVNEVNTILASLGKHPFDQIAALVQKIKAQGEPQIAQAAQAAQAETGEQVDSIDAE